MFAASLSPTSNFYIERIFYMQNNTAPEHLQNISSSTTRFAAFSKDRARKLIETLALRLDTDKECWSALIELLFGTMHECGNDPADHSTAFWALRYAFEESEEFHEAFERWLKHGKEGGAEDERAN